MKKSDILKALEDISDDTEVFIWNGLVGDFQDFDPTIVDVTLARRTKENYRRDCVMDYYQTTGRREETEEDTKTIKKMAKDFNPNEEYELANSFMDQEMLDKTYSDQKTVKVFNILSRNKEMHDRLGTISY